eukprot:TRINITY_DN4693_c0_g1_i2.p2 TRINITY_DN4693_c0_g1~~TRINITY_DN4693_c0_g1_i2.p2  ORF type:complete len:420 (-),score=140.66 TRINITY_DN4693_c0_g1_i2:234-1493(-)
MRSTVVIALLCLAAGAHGASWFASPEGSDSNDGSKSSPFSTIQRAVEAASPNDTVVLLPGVFTGEGNTGVRIQYTTLTITASEERDAVLSWSDPGGDGDDDDFNRTFFYLEDDIDVTIVGLKMVGAERAMRIEDPKNVVIDQCEFQYVERVMTVQGLVTDLRITNSFFHQISETAIKIGHSPEGGLRIQETTFSDCECRYELLELRNVKRVLMHSVVFYNNHVWQLIDSDEVRQFDMFACSVVQNSAEDGMVMVDESEVFSVHNTVFQNNHAEERGGALSVKSTQFTRVDNVTFVQNSSPKAGGALQLQRTVAMLEQCTFANNTVTAQDKEGGGALYVTEEARVIIANSRIVNNVGGPMGGAASVEEDALLDVDSCKVTGNTAVVGGAFQCTHDGRVIVSYSIVSDNVSLSGDEGQCYF